MAIVSAVLALSIWLASVTTWWIGGLFGIAGLAAIWRLLAYRAGRS
ncbi:MAG: hypothetical protein HKN80_06000 [Acidimicrobiia bacterium]|nr:hypothetical protein [Acidimicrobiia bacterium]